MRSLIKVNRKLGSIIKQEEDLKLGSIIKQEEDLVIRNTLKNINKSMKKVKIKQTINKK